MLTTLTLAVTAALWWRRHRLLAVGWLVAMAGNGLLTKILKDVFARVRPEHVHGAAQADGFSFPSGHSSLHGGLCHAGLFGGAAAATGLAIARRVLRGRADLHHRLEPRGAACALRE